MPSGCRSRSSWPLTGRTADRSSAGRPCTAPDQQPAATTTWPEPISPPSASATPRARPSAPSRGQHRGHPVPHDPHPGGRRRLAQRGRVPPVVDRPVAREQHPAVHVRGEEGLQLAAGPAVEFLGVEPGGAAERRQPHQRRVVARVVGDGQRALAAQADPVAGHLLELGRERREPGQGEQVDAEQRALAEQGLRDRGEHPGRHQRRGVALRRIGQDDIEPGRGGPPGDRGSDDTAARDDDICGHGHEHSLRRHYPDQVRRSEARGLPLSPCGLPCSEIVSDSSPYISRAGPGRGRVRAGRQGRPVIG